MQASGLVLTQFITFCPGGAVFDTSRSSVVVGDNPLHKLNTARSWRSHNQSFRGRGSLMAEELDGSRGRRSSVIGVARADETALRIARRPERNLDTQN